MTKVESFWCHEARNIRCVRESDYAALEQECERLRESAGEWGRNCAIAVRERDAALLQVEALRAECRRLESDVASLKADADRLKAVVSGKLSVDVRTLSVIVEGDAYNTNCAPTVRYCQDDADQRLNAAREAIDAALKAKP